MNKCTATCMNYICGFCVQMREWANGNYMAHRHIVKRDYAVADTATQKQLHCYCTPYCVQRLFRHCLFAKALVIFDQKAVLHSLCFSQPPYEFRKWNPLTEWHFALWQWMRMQTQIHVDLLGWMALHWHGMFISTRKK